MIKEPSILTAGYMPLDVIHDGAGTVNRQAGGSAGNVAAIMAFLGWRATVAGQIGYDSAGDELIADLQQAGVRTSQIRQSMGTLTPRLVHTIRADGPRYSYRCKDCDSSFPRSRPLTLDASAECARACPRPTVFFFDRANPATLWLAEEYSRRGSVIVFEPSVPANPELTARAVAVAHIIKCGHDRLAAGYKTVPHTSGSVQIRIITHGINGLDLFIGNQPARHMAAIATNAIDPGGAGDWTTAGILVKSVRRNIIDQRALVDAIRFGQALAAINCTAIGARGLMHMSPATVQRQARAALADGAWTSTSRARYRPDLPRPVGACPSCLMPTPQRQSVARESPEEPAVIHPAATENPVTVLAAAD
jgi:fructokinase